MSSMRNAVTRRPHKERSQVASRQKWGLLEKHKDYSLRAKDYNAKKAKLNILSQKTKERHPDEFAFGMLSASSSAQGKHGRRGDENRLSHEAVQLLKTQDAGYLRTTIARTRKEIERVGMEVGMDQAGKKGFASGVNKVKFDAEGEPIRKRRRVSSDREDVEMEVDMIIDERLNDPVTVTTIPTTNGDLQTISTSTSPAPSKSSPKSTSKSKSPSQSASLLATRKRRKRLEQLRTAKLEVLKKRQREMTVVAAQLEAQRAKMVGGVGGVNGKGVSFKMRERKR